MSYSAPFDGDRTAPSNARILRIPDRHDRSHFSPRPQRDRSHFRHDRSHFSLRPHRDHSHFFSLRYDRKPARAADTLVVKPPSADGRAPTSPCRPRPRLKPACAADTPVVMP